MEKQLENKLKEIYGKGIKVSFIDFCKYNIKLTFIFNSKNIVIEKNIYYNNYRHIDNNITDISFIFDCLIVEKIKEELMKNA